MPKKKLVEYLTFRLDAETLAALRRASRRTGTKVPELVRRAIRESLKAVAVLALLAAPAHAQVVSGDARIASLVAEGRRLSSTFDAQVAGLAARGAVVTVAWSTAIGSRLNAALLDAVTVSPTGRRYYLVVLNARRPSRDVGARLAAPLLAHELQHVFEALDRPAPAGGAWARSVSVAPSVDAPAKETDAAKHVQSAVAREIKEAK